MKKKFYKIFLSVITAVCFTGVLTACSHEHSYTEQIIEPTCTVQGYTIYTCRCGHSYKDNYVDALGHEFNDYIYNDDATCENDGTETATCDRVGCSEIDTREKTNSALGHKFENYKYNNDATCEKNGTETATCSHNGCEETYTREKANSALGHDYSTPTYSWIGKNCTAKRVCINDVTHVETETVTGKYVKYPDATCTTAEKGHYEATFTNSTFTIQTTAKNSVSNGKELGYSFTRYVSDNNATYESDGTKTSICDHKGCSQKNVITDVGSKLEHKFTKYESDNNATYESDGTKTAYCDYGCGKTDTLNDVGSKLQSGITFKTLSVDGENVFGKVSNATETFSFINEITTVGKMKFVVSLDIYGITQVATKVIPLSIGDNIVYVTELIDCEPKNVYTVTVRRRPIHTVTFDTNNGSVVDSQQIEEDFCATEPTTTRTGYTFDKWDYNFNNPITKDTAITASWTANTNTKYKVEYYLQNLENDNYTLTTTENKTGTTDTTATAEIKTFTHFTVNNSKITGNINGNGSTVLKVYYTRNKYTVTFDGNGGTLKSGSVTQTVKYGGNVTAPTFTKTGYTFDKWDKSFTKISETQTITAGWKANQYTITIVYENGEPNKTITQDYNTAITIKNPIRGGYTFSGWNKTFPTTMPAYDITITAKWLAIFTRSSGTITGFTSHGKTLNKISIPEKIDGVTITFISNSAFKDCSSLGSVTIGNSVTSIGDSAISRECFF